MSSGADNTICMICLLWKKRFALKKNVFWSSAWFYYIRIYFDYKCLGRAKSVEHRVLADVFYFFGLENRKKRGMFSPDVFCLPSTFSPLTTRRFSRFGSLRLSLRVAESPTLGTPEGTPPSLRPLCSPSLQTPRPFTPYALFRSFRKVLGSKKVFREQAFFLFSRPLKKKSQQELLVFSNKFERIVQSMLV